MKIKTKKGLEFELSQIWYDKMHHEITFDPFFISYNHDLKMIDICILGIVFTIDWLLWKDC